MSHILKLTSSNSTDNVFLIHGTKQFPEKYVRCPFSVEMEKSFWNGCWMNGELPILQKAHAFSPPHIKSPTNDHLPLSATAQQSLLISSRVFIRQIKRKCLAFARKIFLPIFSAAMKFAYFSSITWRTASEGARLKKSIVDFFSGVDGGGTNLFVINLSACKFSRRASPSSPLTRATFCVIKFAAFSSDSGLSVFKFIINPLLSCLFCVFSTSSEKRGKVEDGLRPGICSLCPKFEFH